MITNTHQELNAAPAEAILRLPRRLIRIWCFGGLSLLLVASLAAADTLVVDDFNDAVAGSMDSCQLRDAIVAANLDVPKNGCMAGNGADVIEFAGSGMRSLMLVASLPVIVTDLEINGPGPDLLVLDGDNLHRMFAFDPGVIGAVRGMTLFQGVVGIGGRGAAIDSTEGESLIVEDVVVESCSGTAPVRLAGVGFSELRRVSFIENSGSGTSGLQVSGGQMSGEDLLFLGNTSTGASPALSVGHHNGGALAKIKRCTFFNNASVGNPAVAVVASNSTLTLSHCTIFGNHIVSSNLSGAVRVSGTLTLSNTIIAGNIRDVASSKNADIDQGAGATLTSLGYNMLGNNDEVELVFPAGMPNANFDLVGTSVALADPDLGLLQDNGGPQVTMLPSLSSPVIDQGSCLDELVDQRGYQNVATGMRQVDDPGFGDADDGCDIGAVERGATGSSLFSDGFESGNTNAWS